MAIRFKLLNDSRVQQKQSASKKIEKALSLSAHGSELIVYISHPWQPPLLTLEPAAMAAKMYMLDWLAVFA